MSQSHPHPANEAKLDQAQVANTSGDEFEEEEEGLGKRFLLFNVMPSWMVSFFTHVALIIFLAIWLVPQIPERKIALEATDQASELVDEPQLDLSEMQLEESDPFETEMTDEPPEEIIQEMETVPLELETFEAGELFAEDSNFDESQIGEFNPSDMSSEVNSRSDKNNLLRKFGGTKASEEAVARALKWIAAHQLPDGGWNFDHRIGPGKHRTSSNAGTLTEARNGATALALLPFLGNGQTHLNGEYKDTVEKGLEFLMKRAKRKWRGLSYHEPGGTMYSHGLVAIVFCEALAMTKDARLAPYAQGTVWFIEDAQDKVGGGWRYAPQQAGDTSAVGWQLMALKSGKLGGLDINKNTYKLANRFLDSVSINSGAYYGYDEAPRTVNRGGLGRTSVGLLCRMYMGWDKNTPALVDGIEWMCDAGPSTGNNANMYYNYYATQAVKHYGGSHWKDWNDVMRDFLVKSQNRDEGSPEDGSWMFAPQSHACEKGGRLYNTSLACMTLEVYYRYLPLYGDSAADDEFPLD